MKLAIFDLDDTLINGDCSSLWCEYLRKKNIVDQGYMDEEAALMQLYREGALDMDAYMRFFLQPIRLKSTRQVSDWVVDFMQREILHRVRPEAVQQINQYQAQGVEVLVISASAHFLVKPIAALMGITEALAIDCQTYKGRFNGLTEGVLSFGEGKVQRLNDWLETKKATPESIAFYSDSINDLPLLEEIDQPFAVTPDRQLSQLAVQRGWPVLRW